MLRCACLSATLALTGAALAQNDKSPTPESLAGIAEKVSPSIVLVEYTARYDKGESPGNDRWHAWASGYEPSQGAAEHWENWDELISEERPALRTGFLIAPDLVFTADPMLHPRFISSIAVRTRSGGGEAIPATPAAYPIDDGGYFLKLEKPLADAKPLRFEPQKPAPYFGVGHDRRDGVWTVRISPLRSDAAVAEDGRKYVPGTGHILVVDEKGTPVAIAGRGDRPIDGSWKKAPEAWKTISAKDLDAALTRLEASAGAALPRVRIEFRSPRAEGEEGMYGFNRFGQDEEEVSTEWNGLGLLADEKTLVILASLKPKVTARLEKIRVFLPDGNETTATFAGSLKDWGAILATLDQSLSGAASISDAPITDLRDKLLQKAEIAVRGDTRTAYLSRSRIASFYPGFRSRLFPQAAPFSGSSGNPYGQEGSGSMNFLFDLEGRLVAFPLARREKVTVAQQWDSGRPLMAPATLARELLATTGSHIDPDNVPLSAEEENRLAWIGVELQGMDPELARANGVIEETGGGQSGAIVSYVYQSSPASAAGIQPGDILLRLHIENHPRPLEVQMEPSWGGGMMDDFWTMMDQFPEEYFDRMPSPWGSAENTLNLAMTDVGFGTPFQAEVFRDGKVLRIPFKVTQGPAHYEAAKRFKSEPGGITVRDLTYEVRRFYQLKDEDPGVIVSKIERGGRAAVAGLKPFEIITGVDDRPVKSAAEFERAIAAGGELKLDVKRMTTGRVVKMRVEPAK